MRVNILKRPDYQYGVFDPVMLNLRAFSEAGIEIEFYTGSDVDLHALADCDALAIDSKGFAWDEETLAWLGEHAKNLLWFDTQDSAGNTSFYVLPYVTKYVKRQFYKDRRLYKAMDRLYGGRLYTDFYRREVLAGRLPGDVDTFAAMPSPTTDNFDPYYSDKLTLGWNLALKDRWPWRLAWMVQAPRKNLLFAAMNVVYQSYELCYQRQLCQDRLASLKLNERKIIDQPLPKDQYFWELQASRACISCFGHGEICYRDFESMVCGVMLIKPDVSCLETWPDLFEEWVTYVPVAWDFHDFDQAIEVACDDRRRDAIADAACDRYRDALGEAGMAVFRERFRSIVTSA